MQLPRHVRVKRLKSGATSFYYEVPTKYRNMKCPVPSEPLGFDFALAREKAETLNGFFDEWDQQRKGRPIETLAAPKIGTVDWLFREYKQSLAYTKKVAVRSRRDYEWAMTLLCDTLTKSGDRVGSRPIRTITPRGADKLYQKIVIGPNGRRDRTAEKVVKLCRKAWRVVHRLFPDEFAKDVPNPWLGVTLESRVKKTKPAVTRDEVYDFAHGCIAAGEPEVAAVAVICFEWLQRPENVIAGHIKWTDYRAPSAPTIRAARSRRTRPSSLTKATRSALPNACCQQRASAMRTGWQGRTNRGIPFGMRHRKAFGMAPPNKERFRRNFNWLGREGSNLRMAESKSD